MINFATENQLIRNIKEWCKTAFYFNRDVVYYRNDDTKVIPKLPENVIKDDSGINYNKTSFETPLSHLLHVVLHIGMRISEIEMNNIINALIDDDCK